MSITNLKAGAVLERGDDSYNLAVHDADCVAKLCIPNKRYVFGNAMADGTSMPRVMYRVHDIPNDTSAIGYNVRSHQAFRILGGSYVEEYLSNSLPHPDVGATQSGLDIEAASPYETICISESEGWWFNIDGKKIVVEKEFISKYCSAGFKD